jgi:hypothetical protein
VSANLPVDDSWFMVIESADGDESLHALVAFEPGEILGHFEISSLHLQPTPHTIQCGVSEHMLVVPDFLRLINHSCDPNIVFDMRDRYVRAIRRIEPGDEIVYFYPSTEWSMAEPFQCCCKSPKCLIRIQGAACLPPDLLAEYEVSEHIALLLAQRQVASIPESFRIPRTAGTDA